MKFKEGGERIEYPGVSPLKELTWITAPGPDAVADGADTDTGTGKGRGKGKKGGAGKGKGKPKGGKGKAKGSRVINPSQDSAHGRGAGL